VRRTLSLTLLALLALVPVARAGKPCCDGHCIEPPHTCPDCSEPHGPHFCCKLQSQCASKLIDKLCSDECCCDRIKAAEMLGCVGDYRCDPEVLTALVKALECDTCWEVRRAAAKAIRHQHACTKYGILALYLASKFDPHCLVRDMAAESLDILTLCRHDCFKCMYQTVDKAAKEIKPYYKPTKGQCVTLVEEECGFTLHLVKLEECKEEKKEECCHFPLNLVVEEGKCAACPGHGHGAPAPGPVPGQVLPGLVPGAPMPGTLVPGQPLSPFMPPVTPLPGQPMTPVPPADTPTSGQGVQIPASGAPAPEHGDAARTIILPPPAK
jgi:hypothetical protein